MLTYGGYKMYLELSLDGKTNIELAKSFKMVFAIVVFMTTVNALHNLKLLLTMANKDILLSTTKPD